MKKFLIAVVVFGFSLLTGGTTYAAFPVATCDVVNEPTLGISQADCLVLKDLYDATDGDSWTNNTGWGTVADVQTWFGVTRAGTDIAQISLGANNLVGDISSWDISSLTSLVYFSLANNSLIGDISTWDISGFADLTTFYVYANNLSGDISAWDISGLTNLLYFQIYTNDLSGDIGSWDISGLTNLIRFYIHANDLSGDIGAWDISGLTNLTHFYIRNNNLSGDIGSWDISMLVSLNTFYISTNQLTGDISTWDISGLTNLVRFYIHANDLSGDIGTWDISGLTNLTTFYINANQLTGDISTWDISGLTNLDIFYIGDNLLSGDIGSWDISGLTNLTRFYLHKNLLSGDIGAWDISGLTNLTTFYLYNNDLSGDIGSWDISGLTNLKIFYIYNNDFSGDISTWDISGLTDLTHFYVQNNNLSGDISTWDISGLTSLTHLSLAGNSLSGDISSWDISGLLNLITFYIYNNNLSGDISTWDISMLTNLIRFYISGNQLTGSISDFDEVGMTTFRIRNNAFTFSHIEPRITKITSISGRDYLPQAKVDTPRNVLEQGGNTLTITPELAINISGNDSYEWFQDGVSLGASATTGRIFTQVTAAGSHSGIYTYEVTNVNVPGLTLYSENIVVTVDDVLPNLTVSVDTTTVPFTVNEPQLTFSATDNVGIDHYEVEYILDNNAAGVGGATTIINPAASPISLDLDPDEPLHTIIVRAIDTVGNIQTTVLKFPPTVVFGTPTLFSTAPSSSTVTITSPVGNDIDDIVINSGITGAVLGGCVGAGADTTLPYASPVVCDIDNIIDTGSVEITARDSVLLAIGQNVQTYTIDTVSPTVTITPGVKVSQAAITDTVITVTDDNGIDAGAVVLGAGTTAATSGFVCTQVNVSQVSCTISIDGAVNAGAVDIEILATDLAGNVTIVSETGYSVDTIAPASAVPDMTTLTDTGSDTSDNITSNTAPDFTVACENSSTVELYIDGTATGDTAVCSGGIATFTAPATFTDGVHTISITETDLAGNISAESVTLSITIDTTIATLLAPTVAGSPLTNDITPIISGICSDGETITAQIDGGDIAPTTICSGGVYSITPSVALAEGGPYAITVWTEDTAGNTSAASPATNISIDTTAPTDPTVNSVVAGAATISGTGEIGTIVTLTGFTCTNAPVIVDGTGAWTCMGVSPAPAKGDTITATSTDDAGNTATGMYAVPNPRGSSGSSSPNIEYTCKNSTASNFSNTGKHKESLCIYEEETTTTSSANLGAGEQCSSNQLLTQNMKAGDRNGSYSSWEGSPIDEVKILQAHMNRLGFSAGVVDGILGPITDGAIKRMQAFLGTTQDGYVGPVTRGLINNSCGGVTETEEGEVVEDAKCYINYTRLIKRGNTGNDVKQAQECVASLGHPTGVFDGIYGGLTYSGIRSYQEANNLLLDGIIGPETAGHLNALSGVELDGITSLN